MSFEEKKGMKLCEMFSFLFFFEFLKKKKKKMKGTV